MHILFLCTGNSCRSVLSEGVFNHLAPQGLRAMSAGSQVSWGYYFRVGIMLTLPTLCFTLCALALRLA